MEIILLSGGSGTRLWPLSNTVQSKQFLRLFGSPNGDRESMIQRVVRQIRANLPNANITFATSKSQRDVIISQIGNNAEIVCEPERRNTFPAIALAVSYLKSIKNTPDDEVVIVMPCDPYTNDDYYHVIYEMSEMANQGLSDLVLMGIKPKEALDKFGYLIPELDNRTVKQFKEKPTIEDAKKLILHGALWNGGVFAFKMKYLIDIIHNYISPVSFEGVLNCYSKFPKISFDHEIVEKVDSISYVEFNGKWKDLGTWDSLCEELPSESIGNRIINKSNNTCIVNELNIPVIVEGVSDLIIALSADGVLVADKYKSNGIKESVETLKLRPMREERRWGVYKVIDNIEYNDGFCALTKQLSLKPGCSISYQKHNYRSEVWTFIDGEGEIVINENRNKVKRGDVISIPVGVKHALKATTELSFIEVQMGTNLIEDDIERFAFDW